jgi:predicted AAA+ superfamily ATPase
MERYLTTAIKEDLPQKIILLTGPRQCGKTTLSKMLETDYQYINYDLAEHRILIREKSWDRQKALVIFDELHKMQNWKSWLKGIYDVEGLPPALLVTGSARLNVFRKAGDSLAGRHFQFRLHPLDLKEAVAFTGLGKDECFDRLMTVGGFPEPFLKGTQAFYNRWKRSHIDLIMREDLLTLTAVRDIRSIETLIELLRAKVGSPVSANALAGDLQKSPNTINNWLKLLEDLYVVFRVNPYHRNIARALLKQPKYYFYDTAMLPEDKGTRLENLVACALLKEIHRLQDVDGEDFDLHYIRNKEGQEIDFLVSRKNQPVKLIEVKWKDPGLSPNFKKFLAGERISRLQIVGELAQSKSFPGGERIEAAVDCLAELSIEG